VGRRSRHPQNSCPAQIQSKHNVEWGQSTILPGAHFTARLGAVAPASIMTLLSGLSAGTDYFEGAMSGSAMGYERLNRAPHKPATSNTNRSDINAAVRRPFQQRHASLISQDWKPLSPRCLRSSWVVGNEKPTSSGLLSAIDRGNRVQIACHPILNENDGRKTPQVTPRAGFNFVA
jgi:hypothetical protein